MCRICAACACERMRLTNEIDGSPVMRRRKISREDVVVVAVVAGVLRVYIALYLRRVCYAAPDCELSLIWNRCSWFLRFLFRVTPAYNDGLLHEQTKNACAVKEERRQENRKGVDCRPGANYAAISPSFAMLFRGLAVVDVGESSSSNRSAIPAYTHSLALEHNISRPLGSAQLRTFTSPLHPWRSVESQALTCATNTLPHDLDAQKPAHGTYHISLPNR